MPSARVKHVEVLAISVRTRSKSHMVCARGANTSFGYPARIIIIFFAVFFKKTAARTNNKSKVSFLVPFEHFFFLLSAHLSPFFKDSFEYLFGWQQQQQNGGAKTEILCQHDEGRCPRYSSV